jgi:hypothetical protein
VDPTIMAKFNNDVVITLVLLEKEFTPFFATVTHLLVHLIEELEIYGLKYYVLDVSNGMLYEDIKGICEEQSKALRIHSIRLHNRGGIKILHKIFARFYNHEVKGVG